MWGVALQQGRLIVGETGAEGRDDLLEAGERQPQHVELSLHEDRALRLAGRVPRDVQVVQQLPLMENRRLRRVQVFRLAFTEYSPTKCNHSRPEIMNRKQQTPPKARNLRAIISFNDQSRLQQHLFPQPQSFHRIQKRGATGREPEGVDLGLLHRDVPRFEVFARRLSFRALAELACKPVGCRGDGREQRLAGIGAARTGALGNGDPSAPRDFTHRGRVVHAGHFTEERGDIARLVADEAVEHPLLGDDGEVAMGPAMKGARSAEIRSGAFQLDVLADDSDQVGRLADLLDHVFGDHANSATVTPWPPWLAGARAKRLIRGSRFKATCTKSLSAPVPLPWMIRRYGRSARTASSMARWSSGSASSTVRPRRETSLATSTEERGASCVVRGIDGVCFRRRNSSRFTQPDFFSSASSVFSIASSTMRRASLAVASLTAARACAKAASTVFRASSKYALARSRASLSSAFSRARNSSSSFSRPCRSCWCKSSCAARVSSSLARASMSLPRASTDASNRSSVRSASGTARSASLKTSAAMPNRLAMASPYDRPGTPLRSR